MSTIAKLHEALQQMEELTIEDCGVSGAYEQQMEKLRNIDAAMREAISKIEEREEQLVCARLALHHR